jgi:predicted phage tail protein
MTDEKLAIYGAKGGGGGGNVTQNAYAQPQVSSPTVAKDSLQSKAYARILDLLGEGEIEGLANGAQSIFFDNTPLQNAGGSFNFRGVIYETRNGTQDQTAISGFSNVENETSVGVTVEASNTLDGTWERAKFVKSSFTRSGYLTAIKYGLILQTITVHMTDFTRLPS